jgi:hypothetical protein
VRGFSSPILHGPFAISPVLLYQIVWPSVPLTTGHFFKGGDSSPLVLAKVILSPSKNDFCGLESLAITLRQAQDDCSLDQIRKVSGSKPSHSIVSLLNWETNCRLPVSLFSGSRPIALAVFATKPPNTIGLLPGFGANKLA